MADTIYTTQVVTEVIETTNMSAGTMRFTQSSVEVIESNPVNYRLRSSQIAVEVILSRQDLAKKFIGWGVPI